MERKYLLEFTTLVFSSISRLYTLLTETKDVIIQHITKDYMIYNLN